MYMYKLKFYSNYCNGDIYKEIFERLCQTNLIDNYGENKDIVITNGEDYTHIVIINTAMPQIPSHIPKENVIGLAYEPLVYLGLTPRFIEYAKQKIGKYFIGDKNDLPDPFVEGYSYMPHITPLNYIPEKKNIMSLMVNVKKHMPGHKYRHVLAERIIKEGLPIDIHGRGSVFYTNAPQCKGKFESLEPYESYMFHIAIENVRSKRYFSEKILNTLLCSATPVYLGCLNIDDYFPNSLVKLNGNIENDIEVLKSILREPEKYRKAIDVEDVKRKTSLIRNIPRLYSSSF